MSVVPNLGAGTLPSGRKMNLRGREMITQGEDKKNKNNNSIVPKFTFISLDFSPKKCFISGLFR